MALFDIVRGRPLGTGVNDPNLGRLTDDLVGQDSGDVFAILKTGYNFDGARRRVRRPQGRHGHDGPGERPDERHRHEPDRDRDSAPSAELRLPDLDAFTIQIDCEQLTVTAGNGTTPGP